MSRFVNIKLLILSGVLITGLWGCGSPPSSDSTTPVTLTFQVPDSSEAGLQPFVSVPSGVASIKLEVTASDMDKITDTFDVNPGETVSRMLEIPSGPDRIFTATAYDEPAANGNALYQGQSNPVDLDPDVPTSVIIDMQKLEAGFPSIEVIPADPSIALGNTQQFTATGTFADGSTQDLTTSVDWTSSDEGVATISASGLASAVSEGTTTITAMDLTSGISDSTDLTVTTLTFTLTVLTAGTGSGTVTSIPSGIDCGAACETSFASDSVVTLTAIPTGASIFGGWGVDCSGAGLTTTVTIDADKTCTATFDLPPFTPFPIATTLGSGTRSVTFDGTNYLMAIQGDDVFGSNITAQHVSQTGDLVGSRISVGRTGGAPSVAFGGAKYLLVWPDDAKHPILDIYGQFINPAGNLDGAPFLISEDIEEENGIGIAFGGVNYLVVYLKVSPGLAGGNTKVYGRIAEMDGTVGGELSISSGFGGNGGPNSVAFDGNNYLVVWTDDANDYEIKGRFVSPSGSLGTEFTINASLDLSNVPSAVAFDGTNYLVVWQDGVDLFGQLVTPTGELTGEVISVSTAPGLPAFPFIAFDGTNYLVTWTDFINDANNNLVCDPDEGTCLDIYGQFISTSGTLVGSEFPINTDPDSQLLSPVVFGGGKYLVVWNSGIILGAEGLSAVDIDGAFITP